MCVCVSARAPRVPCHGLGAGSWHSNTWIPRSLLLQGCCSTRANHHCPQGSVIGSISFLVLALSAVRGCSSANSSKCKQSKNTPIFILLQVLIFFVNVLSVYCTVSISLTVVYSNLLLVLLIRSGFGCSSLLCWRGGLGLPNLDPHPSSDSSLLPWGSEGREQTHGSRFVVGQPQRFCFKSFDLGFC